MVVERTRKDPCKAHAGCYYITSCVGGKGLITCTQGCGENLKPYQLLDEVTRAEPGTIKPILLFLILYNLIGSSSNENSLHPKIGFKSP